MGLPRRVVGASLIVACLVAAAAASARVRTGPDLGPYTGLGAWVSLYDGRAWRDPAATVDALAAREVHTLFLETSNYKQRLDVVRPRQTAAFLDAAHAAGMDVVAWYLPSFASTRGALRRALASVDFVTPNGNRFDSFALDVEATRVRNVAVRNARAAALLAAIRKAMPAEEALGAIAIAPIGNSPSYWPGYPYRALARSADVVLPMAYFTARTHGAAGVRAYSAATVRAVRALAGDPLLPIHLVGGITPTPSRSELRAFVEAARSCGTVGGSLWEFGTTSAAQWAELAPLVALAPPTAVTPPSC